VSGVIDGIYRLVETLSRSPDSPAQRVSRERRIIEGEEELWRPKLQLTRETKSDPRFLSKLYSWVVGKTGPSHVLESTLPGHPSQS
jgi:hypothetical protein